MNQSKEIRKYIGIVNIFAVLFGGFVDYELLLQREIEFHDGCEVVHTVAVIWGGPDCCQFAVEVPLVALLDQLMCPHYHLYFVYLLKLLNGPLAEQPAGSSRVLPPSVDIFLRIRPHKIAQGPRRWYFHIPLESPDTIDCGSLGREASMHAEDLSLDDGSERQVIEGFIEIIPDVMIAVFLGDFIIEAVDIGYIA